VVASYSTAQVAPQERRCYWDRAVSETYFSLELAYRNAAAFNGSLDVWALGDLSLSRLVSDGLLYRRHARHLAHETDESYLITIPEQGEINFLQADREVRCGPGAFLVERSHLPYQFSYGEANALWVLKIPGRTLRARISAPERLASFSFSSREGAGALFTDMVRLVAPRLNELAPEVCDVTGRHLVDLLVMAVEADDRLMGGSAGSVKAAHLHRVEHFIRKNLALPSLTPQMIAQSCGISLRYLHQLFAARNETVCGWIRDQRLRMCDEALRDSACGKSIAQIAYQWGFADQSQFGRHYKARFGRTPGEARELSRQTARSRSQ
jgi:AraC-like DNA-binding protein